MKVLKKLLFVAVASLAFAACGDDNDSDNKTVVSEFTGTLSVSFGDFSMDSIEATTTCVEDTKLCSVVLKSVKFSSNMPVNMDLVIDSISFTANGGDTMLSGTNLNPIACFGEQTQSAGFPISSLTGKITNGQLTLTISGTYSRMQTNMTLSYQGTRK